MLVTRSNFDRCFDWFVDQPRLVGDTETTGLHPWLGDRVCGVALATPDLKRRCYFPIRHAPGGNLRWSQYQQLISLLSQRSVVITGWNWKFDLHMLWHDGMRFPRKVEDVMLACHHLNENDRPFELKRWAAKYCDPSAGASEGDLLDLIKQRCKELGIRCLKRQTKGHISTMWPDEVAPYACEDVRWTERLRRLALPWLAEWKTLDLWHESNAYLLAVAKMEMRGFPIDVDLMQRYIIEAKRNEKKAYRHLTRLAGFDINVRSPKQVCAFLKVSSSAKEILEEMDTPESEAILSYRAWNKARTTYYERWQEWLDPHQVLHPNLNLHRVVTGRQSASDPNLHAVPRYREEFKVKDLVQARAGMTLISCDYNQAELRMGVSLAQEMNMARLFQSAPVAGKRHVDIHQLVADALMIDRDPAKTINFMILYGGGEAKLARKLKIPLLDARGYLETYHTEYWHFRHTSRFWQNRARYQGYIRLWTGRVRHFNHPLANPKDAFNSLVQGGVAEMLRIAITKLNRLLRLFDTHMLLQIHDQILFECPTDTVGDAVPVIRREMEDFKQFLIPPIIDVKVGPRWGALDEYQP